MGKFLVIQKLAEFIEEEMETCIAQYILQKFNL